MYKNLKPAAAGFRHSFFMLLDIILFSNYHAPILHLHDGDVSNGPVSKHILDEVVFPNDFQNTYKHLRLVPIPHLSIRVPE
jgi:hypothetical protein